MACALLGFLLAMALILSGAMNTTQVEGAPLTGWVTGTTMFFVSVQTWPSLHWGAGCWEAFSCFGEGERPLQKRPDRG